MSFPWGIFERNFRVYDPGKNVENILFPSSLLYKLTKPNRTKRFHKMKNVLMGKTFKIFLRSANAIKTMLVHSFRRLEQKADWNILNNVGTTTRVSLVTLSTRAEFYLCRKTFLRLHSVHKNLRNDVLLVERR